MFPEKMVFDGAALRTNRVNDVAHRIFNTDKGLSKKKNRTSGNNSNLSSVVNPQVQNSNSFLEDLRRLNQLKDSPYQHDLEVNQPKPKQPQIPTKVGKLKM